ncbi:MAG: glycosyltransferase family 2 protein [Actinomyces sp.]|uniref:glycosyltransferase family 2 protein n=1 Tax=Actinomyces sp. TaxID=29317 RepID=UPI0026DCC66D|nr:glycosyltransferase family 2 protein [Actinomyces sp.]MDO4243415.1 glycosyltransferase family 2 protein [Actinomyces sp.]
MTTSPLTGASREHSSGTPPLVSVIIASFNAEQHISETLSSVLAQTMSDLEVLVVDDASRDCTRTITEAAARTDPRIRTFTQPANRGAALARNRGLAHATGRYIAYLDSDDLWMPEKLERQIAFMSDTGAGACLTSYETIEDDGAHRNYVRVPAMMGYRDFLKNTVTCSHTMLIDTDVVDRRLLVMPDLRRGQDAATWLQVMRAGHLLHGLDECLARYRKTAGSLSSNKIKAVRRTWNLYRNVERIPSLDAAYLLSWQLFNATMRRRRGVR